MSILRGLDGTIAAAGVIGCGADLPTRRIDEDVAQVNHHRRTIAVHVLDRDLPRRVQHDVDTCIVGGSCVFIRQANYNPDFDSYKKGYSLLRRESASFRRMI